MSFGERLQALRRGSNLTQEEFAQRLEVSRQAVSKWESSRGYPEVEKLIYICNRYGVTMDELFADEIISARPADGTQRAQEKAEARPLKKAMGDFLANLSPRNRQLFGVGVILVLAAFFILFAITVSKGASDQLALKLIWLGLLVVFAVGEAVTVGLTSIWFAAGALAALVCALLGGALWLQIVLFILVSALCLAAIRPIAGKYLNSKVEATNADSVIGTQGIVVEDICNIQSTGAVRLGGMVWSARSETEETISAGTLVCVRRIEGVKVFVEQVTKEVKK